MPRTRDQEKGSTPNTMSTLSDLEEVKAALDKGLVSQAEYDDVKRDYLRAKKKALEAKEEALVDFQKKELLAKEEFLRRELLAKEAFQKRESEARLRTSALDAIVKHGSSIMSEEQKIDLVRDYAKVSGLDGGATVNDEHPSKRQRVSAEKSDASPPQPPTPPAPADAPAPVVAKQARAPRRSNRFRSMSALVKEKEAAAAASEDSSYSDDDGEDEDEDDSDEQMAERRCYKGWTEEDDDALVAALRAGQKAYAVRIGGRPARSGQNRLSTAKRNGSGSPALREYLKDYPSTLTYCPWSAEEDQTFIQAHREGKTHRETAAVLPRRSYDAVSSRWRDVKVGKAGTAALKAYAAECCKISRDLSPKQYV